MLTKIRYSYFALAALVALIQKIVNLLSSKLPDDPMVATMLSRINPQLATAVQAIGSSAKQPLTEKIGLADLVRDNSFRSLRDHIKAGLRRQNEAYRTACEALWLEFEKNGLQLYSISREKETAAINSLLNDLGQAKHEQNVKTVHISKWMEELDTDNRAYIATTQERSAARSTDDTADDADAFKALKESLDVLENVLNTLHIMNTIEGIDAIVDEISQYIQEANTAAKISKGKGNNNNNEEESD